MAKKLYLYTKRKFNGYHAVTTNIHEMAFCSELLRVTREMEKEISFNRKSDMFPEGMMDDIYEVFFPSGRVWSQMANRISIERVHRYRHALVSYNHQETVMEAKKKHALHLRKKANERLQRIANGTS